MQVNQDSSTLICLLDLLSSTVEKLFLCLSSILRVYVSDCSISVISVRRGSHQPLAFQRQRIICSTALPALRDVQAPET